MNQTRLMGPFTAVVILFASVGIGCPVDETAVDGGEVDVQDSGGAADDPCATDAGTGEGDDDGNGGGGGGGGGVVDLDAGEPLPEGRFKCYFGPNYNCTAEGEECCELNQRCYFPAIEPEFCREDECD